MSLPYPPKIPGPDYLVQCACFACRKSFKKDISDPRYTPICPECKEPLHALGRYFRAPRKADRTQWKKVEMLYRAGVYFGGKQRSELGKFPDSMMEAKEFIRENKTRLEEGARWRARWKEITVGELKMKEEKRRSARLRARLKNH